MFGLTPTECEKLPTKRSEVHWLLDRK